MSKELSNRSRPTMALPEILLTRLFNEDFQPQFGQARHEQNRFVLRASNVANSAGQPFDEKSYRDVIISCALELTEGNIGTAYGMFFRQTASNRYLLWTLTEQRRFRVGSVDGKYTPILDGLLADDIELRVNGSNELTVVAIGPSITFVLNGKIVTGMMVDARYSEGIAGAWLQPTDDAGAALALDWVQIRAILP